MYQCDWDKPVPSPKCYFTHGVEEIKMEYEWYDFTRRNRQGEGVNEVFVCRVWMFKRITLLVKRKGVKLDVITN